MTEELVDRIYEAAFVPDEWPDVLERAGRLSGSASGAVMVFADDGSVRGRSVERVRPLFQEFVSSDMWRTSDSVKRMSGLQPTQFVHVDEFLTPEQLQQDPMRARLRALGIGAALCSTITMPSGEIVQFVFQRWLDDGPQYSQKAVDGLNELRPHFARAGLMSARLGFQRAQAAVSALAALGLPAAVLTGAGRIVATNALLDSLSSSFLPTAFGGLMIANAAANALLQQAIGAVRSSAVPVVRSIPMAPTEKQRAMIVHVLPLRRAAHDIFSGADVLIAATEVHASNLVPSPSVLIGLFDLSPAEARLASALASGRSLKDAAAQSNITFKTSRTYLEKIFAKTGTHRQSELVALLKAAQPVRTEAVDE